MATAFFCDMHTQLTIDRINLTHSIGFTFFKFIKWKMYVYRMFLLHNLYLIYMLYRGNYKNLIEKFDKQFSKKT